MSYQQQQQPQQGLPDRNTLMQFFQKYLVFNTSNLNLYLIFLLFVTKKSGQRPKWCNKRCRITISIVKWHLDTV
jgi:hypothetical protein